MARAKGIEIRYIIYPAKSRRRGNRVVARATQPNNAPDRGIDDDNLQRQGFHLMHYFRSAIKTALYLTVGHSITSTIGMYVRGMKTGSN